VSLNPSSYYKIVEDTRKVIAESENMTAEEKEKIITVGYGHVGDGNLHLNISLPGYSDKSLQKRATEDIDTFVMKYVRDARGSVSAEHGIGL